MVMTKTGTEVALKDSDIRVSTIVERLRDCNRIASEIQQHLPPSFVGELEYCIDLVSELKVNYPN